MGKSATPIIDVSSNLVRCPRCAGADTDNNTDLTIVAFDKSTFRIEFLCSEAHEFYWQFRQVNGYKSTGISVLDCSLAELGAVLQE